MVVPGGVRNLYIGCLKEWHVCALNKARKYKEQLSVSLLALIKKILRHVERNSKVSWSDIEIQFHSKKSHAVLFQDHVPFRYKSLFQHSYLCAHLCSSQFTILSCSCHFKITKYYFLIKVFAYASGVIQMFFWPAYNP